MSIKSFNIIRATPQLSSSNSSIYSLYLECQYSIASNVIYTTYTITSILLLPLYILVLYMGVQRWRQSSVPAGTTSHADFFTFHMVIVEIFATLGLVLYNLGTYTNSLAMLVLGVLGYCIIFPGQIFFHCLTSVEHYLAVVHPITYMRLRETGGVGIRRISTGCVWLLCFGWMVMTKVYFPDFPVIPFFCLLVTTIIVILFCCLSVLHVLTHPGPGEVGGHKERVDQSKQRAFYIITAIVGVLLLRFIALLVTFGFYNSPIVSQDLVCALMDLGLCMTVPSSLVLPLLFLRRAGKLPCCRYSTESG